MAGTEDIRGITHILSKGDTEYPLRDFSEEGLRLYAWLMNEFSCSLDWRAFQNRTAHSVIEFAKRENGEAWPAHSLYRIQLDLLGRVGVYNGQLTNSQRTDSSFVRE